MTIDYSGGYSGYITDEANSYVAGEREEIFKKPNEVARSIIEDVMTCGKGRIVCTEIFSRAHGIAKKADMEKYFWVMETARLLPSATALVFRLVNCPS